ncbi:DUF4124 domain-containing protein [Zooshikella sp. RANM57]|uniref:DUF4124 domain-containing protein n=1 Tax=Zooshikella sp. RANM57 TaxID=3425863 RepID=UPI003D6E73C6
MLKTILAVIALTVFVVAPASSEIYKWTDENGKVHFGDKKPEESSPDTEVKTVEDLQINVSEAYEPYHLNDDYITMRKSERRARREARSSQRNTNNSDNSCAAKQARYANSEACYSSCPRRTVRQPDGTVTREFVGVCSCTPVQKPSC